MNVSEVSKAFGIKTLIFCFGFFWGSSLLAQQQAHVPAPRVYAKMQTLVLDTIKGQRNNYLLQISWMDTTFQLDRQYRNFIENIPVQKEDHLHYSVYEQAPWDGKGFVLPHANCHSFGLAQSFAYEGINALQWFSPVTFVEAEALEVLLATAYLKQHTRDATSMKDLMQEVAPGSLLVFRDSSGYAIHTAFQAEEGLLSKNGRYEPRLYHRLDYLKMVYHQALTIDVYRMQADRVKAYLEQHHLQALRQGIAGEH